MRCAKRQRLVKVPLSNLLAIDVDIKIRRRGGRCAACRQPALGVLVEERPRWHDDEEGENGAGEAHVQRQADVLCEVADKEGDDLCA
jgi:hypothetical protein